MQSEIKRFQSMILTELVNHCGIDTAKYDWVLGLGAKPKFDKLCLSPNDSMAHILNNKGKTLCGLHVRDKKEVVGEIWYCSRCLLHKH